MSSILTIQFPKDFNERYQEYRQVLLDVLKERESDKQEFEPQKEEKSLEKEPVSAKTSPFNYNDASFVFKDKTYKPSEETRKKLLRELWRKIQTKSANGEIADRGERVRESELAVLSGFIRSEQEFNFAENKNSFKETIKQLNRIFKDKEFPLTIDSNKEGVLLIHMEK